MYCAVPRVYIVNIDRETPVYEGPPFIAWLAHDHVCMCVFYARERQKKNLNISLTN